MEINEAVVGVIVAAVSLIAVIISVVGPIVRARINRWADEKWQEFEMSLPDNVRNIVIEISRIVVHAVEQMSTGIEMGGKEKLKEAEERVEAWLKMLGYDIELDRIREAIEYVVFEMNKENPTTPKD